jgi:hypothetical protein
MQSGVKHQCEIIVTSDRFTQQYPIKKPVAQTNCFYFILINPIQDLIQSTGGCRMKQLAATLW